MRAFGDRRPQRLARQRGETAAFLHERTKAMLDRPIFQRVIGNDRETATRVERLRRALEKRRKTLHFVVDRDAQRLECAGRRMDRAAMAGAGRALDDRAQLPSGRQRTAAPDLYDCPRDSPRGAFLTELADDPHEFVLPFLVEQIV